MARALGADQPTRRTPNDVSSLCVELLRAVREQEFRARRGNAKGPAPSVRRAWRAWRADLERHGPLHLVADARGLHEGEAGAPIGRGRLDELSRRLHERVLGSVVFEPGLDAPTYAAFVSLLVTEPEAVAEHGGPLAFLPERGTGIRLLGHEDDVAEEEKPESEVVAAVVRPAEARAEPSPARDGLDALEACREDAPYVDAVGQMVAEAIERSEAGDADACYRTVLRLSEHSLEASGRSTIQRSVALDGLRELCSGRRLTDLLGRATGPDREASLRVCRVLLQLSQQVAPALLSAIDVQADPARREELLGIAIALGRSVTPALRRAMEGSSPNRARIAARIAGEIRDERTVPTLARLLAHGDAEVRGEAARALALIGDAAALSTLKRGLESPHEELSALCAYCLGVTGSVDAAQALTETLRQARRERRIGLASAVIRSLGRLGCEESVPELRRILATRSFFRRQELRELKLQAVAALARLPGERAREALEAVATGADMSLAVAARRAVKDRELGGT